MGSSSMPNADRLSELVTIVDCGSIAAAASRLGIPRATLSRRLKALEEELGVLLLNRDTRRLGLTAAGERLLERARAIVEATDEAWRSVQLDDDEPRGELRVSIPPTHALKDLILGFMAQYPEVHVMLMATSRHLDLHSEAVDLALRFGEVTDDALIARQLSAGWSSLFASPDYLDRMGRPAALRDLVDHRCILRFDDGWRPRSRWPLRAGGGVDVRAHFTTNELITRLYAALAGMGLALLPTELTDPYVESGQLEPVLVETIGERMMVQLVYSSRRFLLPQARAFIDFTVERYGRPLEADLRTLPAIVPTREDP